MNIDHTLELVLNEMRNLGVRVNGLPSKSDVVVAVKDGLADHVLNCPMYQGALHRGADEITGVHDVRAYREAIRRSEEVTRPSIPARMAASIPRPLLWIGALLGTAIATAITTWAAQ